MCGIVGYIGAKNSIPILIEGLKRLEYRGYDSAGIGVITKDEKFRYRKNRKHNNTMIVGIRAPIRMPAGETSPVLRTGDSAGGKGPVQDLPVLNFGNVALSAPPLILIVDIEVVPAHRGPSDLDIRDREGVRFGLTAHVRDM